MGRGLWVEALRIDVVEIPLQSLYGRVMGEKHIARSE